MVVRRDLTDEDLAKFPKDAKVRYKPGQGTYGFEDCLETDGRVPGVVLGHTESRVRVELTLQRRGGQKVKRSVNAESLVLA